MSEPICVQPSDEALGAALAAIDRCRPGMRWYARLLLRDGTRLRSSLAHEAACRVEARVATRVREETTRRINESWQQALDERDAELPAFNSTTRCPKCLIKPTDPRSFEARWAGGDPRRAHLAESMVRACFGCGYTWREAPADAETPEPPTASADMAGGAS